MKKAFLTTILIASLATLFLTGCSPFDVIKNNAELCSLINCEQLGMVDISGPNNPLVPSKPDYSKDPTCTLPGLCGPDFWYPFSQAPDAGDPVTSSAQ